MSIDALAKRVEELEALFGFSSGGPYSDRLLALLDLMEVPETDATSQAEAGAEETIEQKLERLKKAMGGVEDEDPTPPSDTIEKALAGIEQALGEMPKA